MEQVIQNAEANRQWKMMLSNIYGVYLILDNTDGQQYVGSAYGQEGLWGRWGTYVATKHGNNKNLIELINREPERYKNFQFSILSVLPNATLKDDVIRLEGIIKKKLGSRAFGLNDN
ncbi:MAG: GIY-YIG nuclease family protein [Negativicutes bacterium]|nr:GIY-YIG nuclease family protein [Negativicutes bacterium]